MPHLPVDTLIDDPTDPAQGLGRFPDALERNVRTNVAASQEHRSAFEGAAIIARCARRSNQSATKEDDRRVSERVPRRELKRQTGALFPGASGATSATSVMPNSSETRPRSAFLVFFKSTRARLETVPNETATALLALVR